MYIKHTSRHYYKLGPNREFYDQENPLGPEATQIVLELQAKYESLIQYLEDAYHSLRSGGTPGAMPSWLVEEVEQEQKQNVRAIDPDSSNPSEMPLVSEPSTSLSA